MGLVPKLHLGTHLSAKLHFAERRFDSIQEAAEWKFGSLRSRKTGSATALHNCVPKCNLGTSAPGGAHTIF